MKRSRFGQKGMTLMEIVVVLAVIAVLAALLTPMILTYIEDAKKAQAQNDATMIAASIAAFMKDTGLPPYKNNATAAKIPKFESGDFNCLVSNVGNEFLMSQNDSISTGWRSPGLDCSSSSPTRDTIENHLINNTPGGSTTKAYQTSGKNAWKGPYLPRVNEDPFGNNYLVNIRNADAGGGIGGAAIVFVISAGPNGKIETVASSDARTLTPGGDDIVARVK